MKLRCTCVLLLWQQQWVLAHPLAHSKEHLLISSVAMNQTNGIGSVSGEQIHAGCWDHIYINTAILSISNQSVVSRMTQCFNKAAVKSLINRPVTDMKPLVWSKCTLNPSTNSLHWHWDGDEKSDIWIEGLKRKMITETARKKLHWPQKVQYF